MREAKSQRRRRQSETAWTDYALKLVPQDAPRSLGVEVYQAVLDALTPLEPDEPAEITARLVHGAGEEALEPWRRHKEIEKIITEGTNQLPVFARNVLNPTEREPGQYAPESFCAGRPVLGHQTNAHIDQQANNASPKMPATTYCEIICAACL